LPAPVAETLSTTTSDVRTSSMREPLGGTQSRCRVTTSVLDGDAGPAAVPDALAALARTGTGQVHSCRMPATTPRATTAPPPTSIS
jgi:hypothetical protein